MPHTPTHTYLHTVSPLALTPYELFNQSHGWTVWTMSLIVTCCVHFKCLTLYLTGVCLYASVCKCACGKAIKETWEKLLISYNRASWLRKHKFYFLWGKGKHNFSTLTYNHLISYLILIIIILLLLLFSFAHSSHFYEVFCYPFPCIVPYTIKTNSFFSFPSRDVRVQ